jgi:hypothetical protein
MAEAVAKKRGRPKGSGKKKVSMAKKKASVGRPKIDINLDELERLSALNCTMPELAAFFKIPLRTLEDRFTNDPKVRDCIERGREVGKLSIRRKQIQIMNDTNSVPMAIWLGKQLLGQRDKHDVVTEDRTDSTLNDAVTIIEELLKDRQ